MKLKMDLEWLFEGCLEQDKEKLRRLLKARVASWAAEQYPLLRARLAADPLSNMSVSQTIEPVTVSGWSEPLWLYLTMCVNRTIDSDATVAVGTTRAFVERLYQGFNQVLEERNQSFVNQN